MLFRHNNKKHKKFFGITDVLHHTGSGGGGGGDAAETTAFLARTSGLDTTHINAYKALINGLVSDGVFSTLDGLWIYATQDSTTSLLNLVSSSFAATTTGSPAFTADRGYQGASGKSVELNIDLTAGGLHYTQNACALGLWSLTSAQDGTTALNGIGGPINIYPRYIDDNVYMRIQDSAGGFTNTDGTGFYLGVRTSSTGRTGYRNGSSVGSYGSVASSAVSDTNIHCPSLNSIRQIAAVVVGGNIDSLQNSLYTRLRTYMTTVGVP